LTVVDSIVVLPQMAQLTINEQIIMPSIRTKSSFGSAHFAHISPAPPADIPRALNIHLTFEEALKLHFSLGQLLAKLNSYNRATRQGRRAAANICLFPKANYITLNEGTLRADDAGRGSRQ
jgi:hypothetical protein